MKKYSLRNFFNGLWPKIKGDIFQSFNKGTLQFLIAKGMVLFISNQLQNQPLNLFHGTGLFLYSRKQKTITFLTFLVGIEKNQFHEIGEEFTICNIFTRTYFQTVVCVGNFLFLNNKENAIFLITNWSLLKLHSIDQRIGKAFAKKFLYQLCIFTKKTIL